MAMKRAGSKISKGVCEDVYFLLRVRIIWLLVQVGAPVWLCMWWW